MIWPSPTSPRWPGGGAIRRACCSSWPLTGLVFVATGDFGGVPRTGGAAWPSTPWPPTARRAGRCRRGGGHRGHGGGGGRLRGRGSTRWPETPSSSPSSGSSATGSGGPSPRRRPNGPGPPNWPAPGNSWPARRSWRNGSRIARELHDIVAHAMSVITVQAGTARVVMDELSRRRPGGALGHRGQRAGRRWPRCGVCCRCSATTPPTGPTSSSARPEVWPTSTTLVDGRGRLGRCGSSCAARATRSALPAGAELAAYRIVQEALTNVCRHARASSASVVVRYQPSEVAVEVDRRRRRWRPRHGRPRPRRDAGTGRPLRRRGRGGSPARRAASGSGPAFPWRSDDDPRGGGRRPAPRPGRLRRARRPHRRPRTRRRGGQRRGGRGPGGQGAAGRAADGHPHARPRRDRGDPADHHRPCLRRRPGGDPDHLRPRRVRLRRPPGRRQRLPAEGRPPEDLLAAIRVVAAGEALLAPSVTRRLIERFAALPAPVPHRPRRARQP